MAILEFLFAPPTPAERLERIRAAAARPKRLVASVAPQPAELDGHEQFMAAHFPSVVAAGYVPPDATPISDRKSGTPATRPPTGNVSRPPQRPPYTTPTAIVPPATPSVQVTPLGPRTPARAQFFTWA